MKVLGYFDDKSVLRFSKQDLLRMGFVEEGDKLMLSLVAGDAWVKPGCSMEEFRQAVNDAIERMYEEAYDRGYDAAIFSN